MGVTAITSKKKIIGILIVFIFLFSLTNQIISPNVLAEEAENSEDTSDEPRIGIIGSIFRQLGRFSASLVPIFRLMIIAVAADPPVIEIGYNETVNINLGMIDPGSGEFEVFDNDATIFTSRYLNFEVIKYPGGTDAGSWFVSYDPYTVNVEKGSILKTNVTISLTSPPIASNAIQSGLFTFRIADTWAYGNLWFPPKGSPMDVPISRFMWFFSAAFILRFGKYSGIVETEYKEISILVKVKPYHALKIDSVNLINLKPDQITSIPITLKNLGNYNDTYNFTIASKHKDIKISNPTSITLAPGETKEIYLSVSVPQSAFDYGTLHNVKIQAYSIHDPNVIIAEQKIFIETKGIYLSEMGGALLGLLFIVLIFAVAFYVHRRRNFIKKHCTKPDKPWEIPKEKKYLDKIKETDKKKYKETMKMMQDEYSSSLLWYQNYCKAITKPKPVKKKEEVKKEKPKEPEKIKIKEEKPKKPKPVKKKKEIPTDIKKQAEDRQRQKIMSKILREQEKQKRKFREVQ